MTALRGGPNGAAVCHARPMVVEFDPLLDKSYEATAIGRDIVDFLAWLELGGAAERTLDQYERDLSRGALMFPSKAIAEWTDGELLQVARAFKPGSRRVRMAPYRSLFKWARRTKRIRENPTETLPTMKQPAQKVIDVFSDEEIGLLCDLPIRDGALMQLLFDTGLRKGEARRLRLMHLRPDPPPGQVAVIKGKGGKDRAIPATLAVSQRVNELAILEGLTARDYLWYTRPGGGQKIRRDTEMGDTSFITWWERCLKESGVRYRNPHVTRHSYATRWLRRGGRLSTLKRNLGHSSVATTEDLYGHLDLRDAMVDAALVESDRSEYAR